MRLQLRRGLNGLATIGATAPFVGLFGTVIGIVNCFRGFSGTPVGFLSNTAGGISEALVTTGLGLLVAVPAVWAYNYFTCKLESFDVEMAHSIDAMMTYLSGFRAALKSSRS
jgi:biopolymer transport protein ExbB/biopolymer transport protein TolQ